MKVDFRASAMINLDIHAVIWYNMITFNNEFFVVLRDFTVMTGLAACRQPSLRWGNFFCSSLLTCKAFLSVYTIMTTGLAGGLTQPYKGMMPAALEAP